jgi:hypothetical protein
MHARQHRRRRPRRGSLRRSARARFAHTIAAGTREEIGSTCAVGRDAVTAGGVNLGEVVASERDTAATCSVEQWKGSVDALLDTAAEQVTVSEIQAGVRLAAITGTRKEDGTTPLVSRTWPGDKARAEIVAGREIPTLARAAVVRDRAGQIALFGLVDPEIETGLQVTQHAGACEQTIRGNAVARLDRARQIVARASIVARRRMAAC